MSEMIERVALNLRLAGICHAHTHSVQIARAAIRVIAPAVLGSANVPCEKCGFMRDLAD